MLFTPEDPLGALSAGELVDDRSLEALDSDSFGHADFVRELAGVVMRTETPANIALFGAWGSGKSGIANLLEKELPTKASRARFVVFDASKYAEAPLRRHFISQVASRLGNTDARFSQGLYTGVEDRDVKFRAGEWAKLAGAFLAAVGLTLAVLLGIAVIVSALSAGSFRSNWSGIVKDYLLATLPVAAVIATFVKLAADGLHLKTTRSAPSGDEEFERLFRSLVEEAKTERLIVFIDELDRCSPAQVASTLETMKTFLFVHGCVFIVAADQQVIEQALRQEVRQHTPEDVTNPYYSAGSSYLDKVFQYQLTLPPLRSPTLSRFALSLVKDRPGVWQRVPSLDEVITVLIPTHVVSPRRVKVLLNRFAIAYRLAERRASEGKLDPDFSHRATELAKLVCLQAEFPLFSDDLTRDARLPEFVRALADAERSEESVPEELRELASSYAYKKRAVAELLVAPDERTTGEPQTSAGRPDDDRAGGVARHHAEQLLNYLRKTRHVEGPAPDLIYLESAGAGHGIDAVRADRLHRAALDNNEDEVLRIVTDAANEGEGNGALLVLADVVRERSPGLEGRNVVSALLRSIDRSRTDLGEDADYIADAVAGHLKQSSLDRGDLLGALVLSKASTRAIGNELLQEVLKHDTASTDVDVAIALLARAQDALPLSRSRFAEITATALLHDDDVAQTLRDIPEDVAADVLRNVTEELKGADAAHQIAVASKAEDESFNELDLLAAPPAETLGVHFDYVAHAAESDDSERQRRADRRLLDELVRLMLALDTRDARTEVARRLPMILATRDDELCGLLLDAARRRAVSSWPIWLGAVEQGTAQRLPDLQAKVHALGLGLWEETRGSDRPDDAPINAAVEALRRLTSERRSASALQKAVEEALEVSMLDESDTSAYLQVVSDSQQLAPLLTASGVADAKLRGVLETVAGSLLAPTPLAPAPSYDDVAPAVLRCVRESVGVATEDALRTIIDFEQPNGTVTSTQWSLSRIVAAAALKDRGVHVDSPLSVALLESLIGEGRQSAAPIVEVWLRSFAATPADIWTVVGPYTAAALRESFRQALERAVDGLRPTEQLELLDLALRQSQHHTVDRSLFAAIRWSEAPASYAAPRLIEMFAAAKDIAQRRNVLELWQQLAPSGQPTQRRLVEEIYLPLVGTGIGGFDLALSHFGLVQDVKGVRRDVTAALTDAATKPEQVSRLDRRLRDAKWRTRSIKSLGRAKDQPEEK